MACGTQVHHTSSVWQVPKSKSFWCGLQLSLWMHGLFLSRWEQRFKGEGCAEWSELQSMKLPCASKQQQGSGESQGEKGFDHHLRGLSSEIWSTQLHCTEASQTAHCRLFPPTAVDGFTWFPSGTDHPDCFSCVERVVQLVLTPWHIPGWWYAQAQGERTSESSSWLLILPPAWAAHLWSTRCTQELLFSYPTWMRLLFIFYAYNQVDEDSTEVKFQVLLGLGGNNFLQNPVLLYGNT